MDFSLLPQKQIKSKLKQLFTKSEEEIISFDKELQEMKNLHKQKIIEEQSVSEIAESINEAEEALYETLMSNIELDAMLALSSRGFELISIEPAKNSNSNITFRKNSIDINLIISDHTRALLQESLTDQVYRK